MDFFKRIIPSSTGVVIAGFSEDDLFPSFSSFEIFLNNQGKIEYFMLDSKINYSFSCIAPFAQRDVIDTFLTGSSVMVKEVWGYYLVEFFDVYIDLIIELIDSNDNLDESLRVDLINDIKRIKDSNEFYELGLNYFFDNLEEIIMGPMLSSINSMPKNELSEMAHSLINIISLRRRIDSEIESVGGDIAVAIITNGDGFKW